MNYLPTKSVIQKLISQQHRVTLPLALSMEGIGRGELNHRHRVKLFPSQSVMHDNFSWKVNCRQHWMVYTKQTATTIQTSRTSVAPGEHTLFESITFLSTSDPTLFQASYVLYVAKENEFLTYDPPQLVLEVPLTPPRTLESHRTSLLGRKGTLGAFRSTET